MATYFTNEGAFDLPEVGFVDRTVHLFELQLEDGGEVGLIVCRTKMPPGKTLREVVEVHVTHEAKKLGGFKILEERDATWAGVPAIEVCSRWRSDGKVIYQRQAHLAASDTWILFGLTGPFTERDGCDRLMDGVLSSFRLHAGG
jgi:hypothetical protein